MKIRLKLISIAFISGLLMPGCNTVEKASMHGLTSGNYTLKSESSKKRIYLEVKDEQIDAYEFRADGSVGPAVALSDTTVGRGNKLPLVLKKQGLDLDITTVLFKYRPSVQGQVQQFTNDMNLAIYSGWRFDRFVISTVNNQLQKPIKKVRHFAYDFGFILGAGTTPIDAFSTKGGVETGYSALLLQSGIAGFVESNIASFGLGLGWDFLAGPDRNSWIYERKPYLGIIVGIALN